VQHICIKLFLLTNFIIWEIELDQPYNRTNNPSHTPLVAISTWLRQPVKITHFLIHYIATIIIVLWISHNNKNRVRNKMEIAFKEFNEYFTLYIWKCISFLNTNEKVTTTILLVNEMFYNNNNQLLSTKIFSTCTGCKKWNIKRY